MNNRAFAPRTSGKESPAVLEVSPGANAQPQRITSMIADLTESVRQCQFATS
jgi:hypothetical protein